MRPPTDQLVYRAVQSRLSVGLNPQLPKHLKHGTVWFEVSGFGLIKRDFLVDDRELLVQHPKTYSVDVARQIMLIDPTLPKQELLCRPARIDIVGKKVRRIFNLPAFHLVLEQSL